MDLGKLVDILDKKVEEGTKLLQKAEPGTKMYERLLEDVLGTLYVLGNFHKVGISEEEILVMKQEALDNYKKGSYKKESGNSEETGKEEIDFNKELASILGKKYQRFIGDGNG